MEKPKNIEIVPCFRLNVVFESTEGLNKFIEFLLQNKIKGLGTESSKKNIIYTSFFTEEEMKKINKYFN